MTITTHSNKQYPISPVTGRPIPDTHEEVLEDWWLSYKAWHARLMIARAETPSTMDEINNCPRCHGTSEYHHCFNTHCKNEENRFEECLHPSEVEWAEFAKLSENCRFSLVEVRVFNLIRKSGLPMPMLPVDLPGAPTPYQNSTARAQALVSYLRSLRPIVVDDPSK